MMKQLSTFAAAVSRRWLRQQTCRHHVFLSLCLLVLPVLPTLAADSYTVDTLAFPPDMPPEVGGIEFASDGSLYLALRRGDILVATPREDPKAFKWKRFATGFHNACGIHVVKPGHVVIGQMAELTEVIDHDGDLVADEYKNLSTDFGISGNYHETMDICSDGAGGYFLAPGTASHNGPTFFTPRGEYSKTGRTGRNYSAVKWRGWVLHWTPDGGMQPFSCGYRMHNGIERDPDGNIWCGDNQGDWRAVTPLYHVTKDSFMGHPSALAWDERFTSMGNHLYLPRILMDDLWNKPAFHLPHGMVRSVAEPVFDTTGGAFGPFTGQMFVPDQSGNAIVRCMPEWIDGAYQGAALVFRRGNGLNRGGNRLAFSPDGKTMYVGQTGRGWGKLSEGVQRIHYSGELPFTVQMCSLRQEGFRLTFTRPVKAAGLEPTRFSVERYRYKYSHSYGSKEQDRREVDITAVTVSGDGKVVDLQLAELLPNYIYKLQLAVDAADGEASYADGDIIYTMNRLRRPESDHKVTLEAEEDRAIHVAIDGKPFTTFHMQGFSKPLLYPILNADGSGMTRDWPIASDGRSGEEEDHPHHKALFIGHQGVSGTDNWHEDRPTCGTIEHVKLIETRSGEDRALLRTMNLWKDKDGEVMCSDTRAHEFGVVNGARYIDLELNVHASNGDVTFEEYKDGFIGLRTHPHLRLKANPGKGVPEVFGQATNSVGDSGPGIWGKRAEWVHYFGKVEGKDAGIAILAHPSNPREPTWWHARDYGLVAANPFGPKQNGADGELVLPAGQTLTLRYRFLFHTGEADVAAQFTAYSEQALPPRTVVAPIPGVAASGLGNSSGAATIEVPKNVTPRGGVIGKVTRTMNGKTDKPAGLVTNGLVEGNMFFMDREYRIAKLPDAVRGADMVRTFNNDKKAQKAAYELEVTGEARLLILLDTRVGGPLGWMQEMGFQATKDTVRTNFDFGYTVYQKDVGPGTYRFGDQFGASMYVIGALKR